MTNIKAIEPSVATDDHDRDEYCDPAAFKARYFREGPNTFAEHMAFPDAMVALERLASACPHLPFKSWGNLEFNFSNDDEIALRETKKVVEALRVFATWLEGKAAGYSIFASENWQEHIDDAADMGMRIGDYSLTAFLDPVGTTWRVSAINLWDTCVTEGLDGAEEDELLKRTVANLFSYLGMIGHHEFQERMWGDLHCEDV